MNGSDDKILELATSSKLCRKESLLTHELKWAYRAGDPAGAQVSPQGA